MKPKNLSKKLMLNKKTVAHLNGNQMKALNGGGIESDPIHVESRCAVCPTWGNTCISDCATNCNTECETVCNSDPCCR